MPRAARAFIVWFVLLIVASATGALREATEDYNLLRGRIWILVLLTTAVAPRLCAMVRGVE